MAIPPKSGTDYSALQQNNPYRNYEYKKSFWDRVGDTINAGAKMQLVKTPEMKYAEQMENQARAYDSQIAEVQREELYNSAGEQAMRMRAAGINPDLQGSGITAGEASPMDNQANPNMPNSAQLDAEISQRVGNVFTAIISIPSTVLGVVGQGLQIANMKAANDTALNQRFESTSKIARDFIYQWFQESGDDLTGLRGLSRREIYNRVLQDPQTKANFSMFSQRSRFAHAVANQAHSMLVTKDINTLKGEYLRSKFDPMNYDQTMVQALMSWTAAYNQSRIQALTMGADADQLGAQVTMMQKEAVLKLVDVLQSLYDETNDMRYAYSIIIANQILDGQIIPALATFTTTKGADFLLNGNQSQSHNPDNSGSVQSPTGPDDIQPSIITSEGVGTSDNPTQITDPIDEGLRSGELELGEGPENIRPAIEADERPWYQKIFDDWQEKVLNHFSGKNRRTRAKARVKQGAIRFHDWEHGQSRSAGWDENGTWHDAPRDRFRAH